ncbi:MAG: acyltransferase [Anaerolineae bacterium]|nr:acyltransferase [Anaerolineae bacterium]
MIEDCSPRPITEGLKEGLQLMRSQPSQSNYLTGIDGLRAIAISAVLIFHIESFRFIQGGFTGVDMFFVISGYVISKSLSRKSSLRFPDYLSEFYKSRIIRIFPSLIVCLVVTILASTLFIPSAWLSSANNKTGLAALLGYSNFALVWHTDGYFSPRVEYNPFLHTWALAVEMQFYLLFPLLFYVWLKFNEEKSAYGYLSRGLLLGLAMLSLIYAYFETASSHDRAFYLLPSRFWELAAGALLFQLHSRDLCVANSKRMSEAFLVSGIVLSGIGFFYATQDSFPFPWALVPVFGTTLLISGIASVSGGLSVFHKFFQSKMLTYIGRLSFSLYLWHWPVSALFRWTVGFDRPEYILIYLIIVFLLAAASYHFVESPVRTQPFLLKQQNWKLITGGLAVVLISYGIANAVINLQPVISLSVTRDQHTWYPYAYTPKESSDGNAYADLAGRKLFAIGDSHTAAYKTMLKEVSSQLGIEVYSYEYGGCPIVNLLAPMKQTEECQAFYDSTLAEVKRMAQPNDIIFFASLRMPELADQFEVVDEAAVIAKFNGEEAAEKRQVALEEADRLLASFDALGVHILIDAPKPVTKSPPYRCSDWFNRMNPICSPGFSVDRELLLELRQPVMDSLKTLEGSHPDLSVWDPFPVLCKSEICSAYDDGKPLFFDGDHLSAYGNRVLIPSFRDKLLSIWRR